MTDTVDADWSPIARLRTHEQVLARIEDQILAGKLRPGARLPGERQLAEMLGVSRGAVREALRVLEAMGVVTAGVGSGPAAGSLVSGANSQALTSLLRLHLALARFSQREVIEVRIQLERWAVSEATVHATRDDLDSLWTVVEGMRRPGIGPEEFNDLDTEFHVAVAQMAANALLGDLMQALREVVRREMLAVFAELPDWRSTASRLTDEHQGILEAIERGDSAGAASAVEKHIAMFYGTSHGYER